MKKFLSKISQSGLQGLTDPLDYRRVLFVNILSLITSAIAFLVTVLLFLENVYPQFYVTLLGGLFFLQVVYFNHLKQYVAARTTFLLLSVVLISVASYIAYGQGRLFNEVENILIGFMAVNYLLYDGRLRYLGFISIYGVLISLKFLKQGYLGQGYDLNFYLALQNITILCLLMFLFVDAFRRSLLRAFHRLREKDEILYSMIDNVPIYIGLFDTNKKYKMVNINYEKSFGKVREEIIGSHVRDVLPDNILKEHLPLIERALNGENPEFLELATLPDGTAFYAGGKYTPVYSEGEIIGVSVFVNDVTKLEEAKNKLKAANSTKDKLFSIIAHDVRGPLDLFDGLLDYSSQVDLSKEEFFKHQNSVKEKLTDLRVTVNTLLDWARSQLDGVNVTPTPTPINEIVKSNIDLYKEFINQKNIQTKLQIHPEAVAFLDANHLKIGVRNMVHNALKFTKIGGVLSIRGFKDEDRVFLEIEDNGVGIEPSKIDSIMNKELQSSKSGTAGESGTGLGLSFSLELLEKNNCDVTIDSQVGKGTKVTISMLAHQN